MAKGNVVLDQSSEGWWMFNDALDDYVMLNELDRAATREDAVAWAASKGYDSVEFLDDIVNIDRGQYNDHTVRRMEMGYAQ